MLSSPSKSKLQKSEARRTAGQSAARQLAERGIVIGVTSLALKTDDQAPQKKVLTSIATRYPLLEIVSHDVPSQEMLAPLLACPLMEVSWFIEIEDLADLSLEKNYRWKYFLDPVLQQRTTKHRIVLSLDRHLAYSREAVEALKAFLRSVPLPVHIEALHSAWKQPSALRKLNEEKIPQVYLDAPRLYGIVKDVAQSTSRTAYLRLVGRNAITWFEHDLAHRYVHRYSTEEIEQIARRAITLLSEHDTLYIVNAVTPGGGALEATEQLAQLLLQSL